MSSPASNDALETASSKPSELPAEPVDSDPSEWSSAELMRRCVGLGASDEQIGDCLDSGDTRSNLIALIRELEPPSPQTVKLEDLTIPAPDAREDDVVRCLQRYGACIIEKLAPEELLSELDAELEVLGIWETRPPSLGVEAFFSAPRVAELTENELVLGAARRLLFANSRIIQLKSFAIGQIPPGSHEQLLHREDGQWPFQHQPHVWCVDAIWALSDFTAENGSTCFVPYSQHWRRRAENERPDLRLQAVMPRGSVFLFTGGTLHGAGYNTTTDQFRRSVYSAYSVGWLMPEMRHWPYQHLRANVDQLSPTLQDLLGFGLQYPPGPSRARISEDIAFDSEAIGGTVDENWDTTRWNHPYLMRSVSQVSQKETQTDQEVGNRWFDESFYSSPMWRPTEPNPEKDGDYITRLRKRRKWTMSPPTPRGAHAQKPSKE